MSYVKFVPKFWSEKISRENEKILVLSQLCNREYEGTISKKGDTVHILSMGKAKIGDYTGADIGAPEVLTDSENLLVIDKAKYFNVAIDDIDKRQAVSGVMDTMLSECNYEMAEAEDSSISAAIVAGAQIKPTVIADLSTAGVRKTLRSVLTTMQKNGVKKSMPVVAIIGPDELELLEEEVQKLRTDNDDIVDNGYSGKTAGIGIYVSTNLPANTMLMFTKGRAIAHAKQLNDIEPYRPQGLFSDAIKGLNCFGTKVVKPLETAVITYTAI